jgi:hypothetical protein
MSFVTTHHGATIALGPIAVAATRLSRPSARSARSQSRTRRMRCEASGGQHRPLRAGGLQELFAEQARRDLSRLQSAERH